MSLIPISTSTYVNTISTSTVLTLPPASTVSPTTIYYIQDATGNAAASTIYIYTSGTDTIENQTLAFLNANFASIFLASDSISNWMVMQYYASQYGVFITYIPGTTYITGSVSANISAPSFTYTFYQNTSATSVGATVFQTLVTTAISVNTTNTLLQGYYYYFTLTTQAGTVTSLFVQAAPLLAAPTNPSISIYSGQGQAFNYISNATQTFVVPSYITQVNVSLSGAGGGGYGDGVTQYFRGLGLGGSGALVTGILTVTPGSTLLINAPSRGTTGTNYPTAGWPGGGGGGYGANTFGVGGGYAAIQYPSGTYLVIAGGGGGAGNAGSSGGGNGGNGGLNGVGGGGPYPGGGGTTTTGGAAGSGPGLSPGTAGTYLQGGTGAGGNTGSNGGGGGGGLYGGGGGAGQGDPGGNGGGGGSSLVTGAGFALSSVITGGGATQNTNGSVTISYGANPTASWASVSGASSYTIIFYQTQTKATSGGTIFQVFTGIAGTTQGSTNIPLNGYYYYATIVAIGSTGYYSPAATTPSQQISTITPAPMGLPGVPATASITLTSSAITAIWTAGSSASSYIVIFYQNNTIFQVFTGLAGTTQTTTLTLTSGSSYYATVTSVNSNGYSATSATTATVLDSYSNSLLTTITGYPGNPYISIVYPNTLICTWTGVIGTTYTVSFYGGTSLLQTFTVTTATSQSFATPLIPNALYYANVTTGIYSVNTINVAQANVYPYIAQNAKLSFTYPSLTVSWSPSQQTTSYSVAIYNQANQQVFTTVPQTTSVSYTPTTTSSYYATITSINLYGSTSITTASVQVAMTPVTSVTLNISSTSLLAAWTSANGVSYSITFYYNANNNTTQGTAFNTVKTTNQTVTVPLYSTTTPYYYYAILTSTNSYGSSTVTSAPVNYSLPAPTITILTEGTKLNQLFFTWSSTYTNSWTFVVEIQEGALQIPFTTINGTGSTGGGTVIIGSSVVFIATATVTGPGGTTRTFFAGNTGIVSSTPSYIVVPPSLVPSATISLQGLYALASWTAASNATSYTITFYQGTSLFQTVTSVTQSTQVSAPLVNGYTYSASIVSVNSYAFSQAFTTTATGIVQNPPTQATNATLTLAGLYALCQWSGAINATSYIVRFYQNTINAATGGTLLETDITQSLSQTSTTPLTLGYYYYGTVTSVNIYGSSAPFATAVIITNQSPPQPPATLTLILSGFYAKATWPATTYAASYTVTFYQNATASTVGGAAVETDTTAALTQTTSTPLLNGYYYYAAVTANNAYGSSAASTTPFTTVVVANKPMPSSTVTISFSASILNSTWAPATNALTYTVTFYQVATPTVSGGTLFETDTGITNLNTTAVTVPLNGFYYYSSVLAINTYGSSAATTSSTVALVNGLLPSTIPTIIMSFAGSQVTASWSASANAATYTILFYQTPIQQITGGATFESDTSVTSSQTTTTSLINSYYYYAVVTPINTFGYGASTTSGTAVQAQVLPFNPTSVSISFAGTQVTVAWSASSYSTSYIVTIYQRATAGLTGGSTLETDTTSSTSQASLTGLTFRNYYYATVTGVNQYGSSSSITTTGAAQAAFTPLIPTNASITPTTFQAAVGWTAASYTNTYTVKFYQVATQVNTGGLLVETASTASTTLTSATILLNSFYYYATVQAVNEFSSSAPVSTDPTAIIANGPTSPTNVRVSLSGSKVNATWTAAINADSYTVSFYQVATAVTTGGTLLETGSVTTTVQATSTTLLNGFYYYATVQAVNAFGSSSTATSATPLLVTTILPSEPSNVAVSFAGTQVTATWTASPANATSYRVIFYQNNNASTSGGIAFETTTGQTGTTQLSSSVLLNDYYYYATVQGVNANGSSAPITSANTTVQITGILPTLPTSVTISFAGTQLTATWVASAKNPGTYTVVFYQVPTRITTDGIIFETDVGSTSSPQSTTTVLVNGYYYYAKVIAVNAYGSATPVASATATSLITTILPTVPSNVAVSFAGTQVTATWSPSAFNATSYTVRFYQVASSQTTGGTLFETDAGQAATTQLSSTVLLNGYYYYATVAGINVNGSSAQVTSAAATIQITGIAPTNPTAVAIGFAGTQLTASWTASTKNALTYTVVFYQVATAVTTGGTLFETDSLIAASPQQSSTILVNGYYYYATVTAINQYTTSSTIASATSTALITTILPTAPSNVAVSFAGTQVTATWSPSAFNATSYTIRFYQVASSQTTGGTLFETDAGQTGTTQLTSTTLLNGYYYYATVAGINVNGSSAIITSAAATVQITTILPSVPISPTIVFSPNYMTASWTASLTNIISYIVEFYQNTTATTTGGTLFETDSGISGLSQVTLTSLVYNQYYYAIIYGVNTNGSSAGVTTSTAAVAAFAPLAPTNVTVSFSGTQVTASWTASSYTSTYTIIFYQVASAVTTGGIVFETDTGQAGTSQLTSSVLVNNQYYYATVTSVNPYSTSSAIVSSSSTVQISGIYPTDPFTVSISLSANYAYISWNASAKNAISYTVVIYNPTTNTTTGGTVLETDTGLTGISTLSVNTLTSGQYYYATVTAINTYGSSSTITSSSAMLASILPTGGAITLNSGLLTTGGSVTITAAATLATGYTVYISTSTSPSGFSFTTTTVGSAVNFSTTLTAATTYYAVLVPYNTYGNGTISYSSGIAASLYAFSGTLAFTTAGASGSSGPILSQCVSAYSSFGSWVSNTAYFNMTTQGNQLWTVPTSRNYTITCAGCGSSGKGAIQTATIYLTAGHIINIVCGQYGTSGSGNGGSFVHNITTNTLLMASGAGGTYAAASLTTSGSAGGGAGGVNGGSGSAGTGSYYTVTNYYVRSDQQCINQGLSPGGNYTTDYAYGAGYGGNGYSTSGIYSSGYNGTGFGGGGSYGSCSSTDHIPGVYYYLTNNRACTYYPGSNTTTNLGSTAGGGGGYSGGGGGNGNGTGSGGGGSYCIVTPSSSSITNTGQGYVSIT
jgi:hypothetical protein